MEFYNNREFIDHHSSFEPPYQTVNLEMPPVT
jgi:hypothetical protein